MDHKIRYQAINEYRKQLDNLQKEWGNVLDNDIPDSAWNEFDALNQILKLLTSGEATKNYRPEFRIQGDEALEYELIVQWLNLHAEEHTLNVEKLTPAIVTKFLIHFFVTEMVLAPNHLPESGLSVVESNGNDNQNVTWKLQRKLEDVMVLLSFLTSMEIEVNTLPMDDTRVLNSNRLRSLQSELKKNSTFQNVLAEFKGNRQIDKQNLSHKKDDEIN